VGLARCTLKFSIYFDHNSKVAHYHTTKQKFQFKKAMESLHFNQNEEGLRIPSLLTPFLGQKPLVTTKKSHKGGVA
jgi:hypothetical protein